MIAVPFEYERIREVMIGLDRDLCFSAHPGCINFDHNDSAAAGAVVELLQKT